ncbi:MAG: hypothetical protein A3G41_00345 [Elusimicrobia bacterium RIFCSPLOWO2_12_FULL_59_9]|nr:MAG: hypothetical protein A3G41_00345 [Elusimicrobia bacterium RIFCSPLOWO2_12_FULL_59_9]
MMKIRKGPLIAAAVLGVLFSSWLVPPLSQRMLRLCPVRPGGVRQAGAVPVFARKYGISCSQCHTAFPVLNDYGREFKNNGFVREREKESGAKIEASDMFIPSVFPWGAFVKARPLDIQKSGGQTRKTQNRALHELELFVADGSVAKNFSYFTEIEAEDDGGTGFEAEVADLSLGYHPSPYFNVIAGFGDFLHKVDPYQTLAHSGFTRRASDVRELLMLDQQYLAVRGEASQEGLGALSYAVGLGGGQAATTAATKAQEGYGPPNYNLRLVADTLKGLSVGAFFRTGKDDLTSKNATGTSINKMSAYAVDALVEVMDLNIRGAIVNAQNKVAATGVLNSKNSGGYLEAFYTIKKDDRPWIVPLLRFDTNKDKAARKKNHFLANLSCYLAENVRGFVEYYDELSDKQGGAKQSKDTRWTAQVEVGF